MTNLTAYNSMFVMSLLSFALYIEHSGIVAIFCVPAVFLMSNCPEGICETKMKNFGTIFCSWLPLPTLVTGPGVFYESVCRMKG